MTLMTQQDLQEFCKTWRVKPLEITSFVFGLSYDLSRSVEIRFRVLPDLGICLYNMDIQELHNECFGEQSL